MSALMLRMLLTSLVKGQIWKVVVVLLGVTCWTILMTDCESESRAVVSAVLVVSDVLVS